MDRARIIDGSILCGNKQMPISTLVAVVATDSGNIVVFKNGQTAVLDGDAADMYSVTDLCPWVRFAV